MVALDLALPETKAASELTALAAAMARSARLPMLQCRRAANSHSRSQSRSFGHGLIKSKLNDNYTVVDLHNT